MSMCLFLLGRFRGCLQIQSTRKQTGFFVIGLGRLFSTTQPSGWRIGTVFAAIGLILIFVLAVYRAYRPTRTSEHPGVSMGEMQKWNN